MTLPPAVQACHEAVVDRVAPGRDDDRYRRGCSLGRKSRSGVPDDYGRPPANQIGYQRRQSITLVLGPAIFDRDVLAVDEIRLLQALEERRHEARRVNGRGATEKPDHGHCVLLRARGEWPRRRAAEQCDYEFSPPDVECHAIPPAGGRVHAIDGTISHFSESNAQCFGAANVVSRPCLSWVDTVEKGF